MISEIKLTVAMPDSVEDLRKSLRKLREDIDRGSVPPFKLPEKDPAPVTPALPVLEPELEVIQAVPASAPQRVDVPPEASEGGIRFGLIAEIFGLGAAALGCWFDYGPLAAGGLSVVIVVKLFEFRTRAGAGSNEPEDK